MGGIGALSFGRYKRKSLLDLFGYGDDFLLYDFTNSAVYIPGPCKT